MYNASVYSLASGEIEFTGDLQGESRTEKSYEWLKDVLTLLPMHPINRIKELLPHNWKSLQALTLNSS